MKVKYQIIVLLSIALLCSVFVYTWNSNRFLHQQLTKTLEQFADQMQHIFRAEQDSTEQRMLLLATFVAHDPKVQKLFYRGKQAVELEGGGAGGRRAEIIREQLYYLVSPGQEGLSQRFQFRQLHFHLGPGSLSFLRVHRPEQFGDRMDEVRYTVVDTNAKLRETSGFETGRVYSGIRGVVPVYAYDIVKATNAFVGALEAGTSYAQLLEMFKTNYPGLEAAVLLSQEHLKANVWPEFLEQLIEKNVFARGYMVEASTSPNIEPLIHQDIFPDLISKSGNHLWQLGAQTFSLISVPLRDYHGEQDASVPDAGVVLLWRDVSSDIAALNHQINNNYRDAVLFFILVELLILFGVRTTTAQLQKELQHTRQLELVSEQAVMVASSLDEKTEQPQLQLHYLLQRQLDDLIKATGAGLGLFVGNATKAGEYQILAVSEMVWSVTSGQEVYEVARQEMAQQGYFPCRLEGNQIVQAIGSGNLVIFDEQQCRQLIAPVLPDGHPPIRNLMLAPVAVGQKKLGVFVLANRTEGFSHEEKRVAIAYAGAAALFMHADLREVARIAAEESSRLKTEFLNTMSHELRTPLNAIMGLGQLLSDSDLDHQQQDYLGKINLSSKALLNLIDEIMLVAQLEADETIEQAAEMFSMGQLFNRLSNRFSHQAKEQGIRSRFEVSEGSSAWVKGHPETLERVLRQLLGNAIKFSSQGEIVLSAKPISLDEQQVVLEFSVSDQGQGIEKELQAKIFQPFFQGDGSNTRKYGGTGLGLTIAQKLCHQLGGEIKVVSTPGQGSCFSFQLAFERAVDVTEMTDISSIAVETAIAEEPKTELGTATQLLSLLDQLEDPLIKLQAKPCQKIAGQLKKTVWSEGLQDNIDELVRLMMKYRFTDAQKAVIRLKVLIKQNFELD